MWIVGVIILVVAIFAVYWFVIRKPEEQEVLPPASEPKRLRDTAKKKPENQRTLKAKEPAKKVPEPTVKKESTPKSDEPKSGEPKSGEEKIKTTSEEISVEVDEKQDEEEPRGASDEEIAQQTKDAEITPMGSSESSEEEPAPLVAKAIDSKSSKRARDVAGLRKGLGKSRAKEGFFGRLAKLIIGQKEIDPNIVDEMEEVLITSDVGVKTTEAILDRIRDGMKSKELDNSDKVWAALREEAVRILSVGGGGLPLRTKPTVVLMVGVNGSGKTTTIGKIATQLKGDGREVLLAAGDTFRAAAVQQLQVWGRRVDCDVVKGKDGADPGAVIFDAIRQASDSGADVVLADTAGRLHTKTNLMDELKKVVRTMGKAMEGAPHEILLVIDATNGQNALAQSRQFAEVLGLTGIVLTKLDGTAKGGVILGICDELKVPVRYIGIGEKSDDLRPFEAEEFVEALLGSTDSEEIEAA